MHNTKQLDQRFRKVPKYATLKLFRHYSLVTQWTGSEFKNLFRQLIPVLAPLLTKDSPYVMHCIRAIIDFVKFARYISHTEETLGYMQHALFRMDKIKEVFRKYRSTVKLP